MGVIGNTLIEKYVEERRFNRIRSIILYKDDELLVEKYFHNSDATSLHDISSIWKGIMSLLIGIALDRHQIKSTEVPIYKFIEYYDLGKEEWHHLLKVKHLLTMTSGIMYGPGPFGDKYEFINEMYESEDYLYYISEMPMEYVPGLKFNEKEWDPILLSAIIQKASGVSVNEYCKNVLFEPLEIQCSPWPESRSGSSCPIISKRNQMMMSALDLAKIGELVLHQGLYCGKRIVSRGYVKEMLTPSPRNPMYGYLWNLYPYGYGLRGYGGQELIVLPDKHIVYVIQADFTDINASYDSVLTFLIDQLHL